MFVFITRDRPLTNRFNPEKIGVLISAVNNYKNTEWNLKGPVNDALLLESKLKSKYNIPEKNIIRLIDSNATKKNILEQSKYIVDNFDEVIFSWSGHGTQIYDETEPDMKEEVIVTWDHNWDDVLMGDDIYAIYSKAKKATIILDCCHAQGGSKDGAVVKSIIPPHGIKFTKRPKVNKDNITEIAACLSHQLAYEEPIKGKWHGIFTYYLCQIIEENPLVTVQELQILLNKYITKQTPSIYPLSSASLFLQ